MCGLQRGELRVCMWSRAHLFRASLRTSLFHLLHTFSSIFIASSLLSSMLSWLGYLTGQATEPSLSSSSAHASSSKLAPPSPPPAPSSASHEPMLAPSYAASHEADEALASPMMTIPLFAFALGFVPATYTAASRASLVFMAENAHRRPDTVQGWYFYNKTKVCLSFPSLFSTNPC